MKQPTMSKFLAVLLAAVMLLAVPGASAQMSDPAQAAGTEIVWDENGETILLKDGAEYGEGDTSFTLAVFCLNEIAVVTVNTDADTVGGALAELGIVAGEDSEFGLYVKTVNGITADYETDGSYWAFYIDNEYAMTGVDATEINPEAVYLLKVEGRELEEGETIPLRDGGVYGIGETAFSFQVVDADKNTIIVTVRTDADTVGGALAELGIVAGEDSEFGLYVKTVNGITADYEADGTYWAFYIDGEYAMTGVDATEINPEAVYTLAVEG